MKLIAMRNLDEGMLYPSDVFLAFGKKLEGGWYFRIELPFTFIDNNYYDIYLNTYKQTKCRKVYCLIYRKYDTFIKLYSNNYPVSKG
jgi:hypothetical protein